MNSYLIDKAILCQTLIGQDYHTIYFLRKLDGHI